MPTFGIAFCLSNLCTVCQVWIAGSDAVEPGDGGDLVRGGEGTRRQALLQADTLD
jgi:hypothetical protein